MKKKEETEKNSEQQIQKQLDKIQKLFSQFVLNFKMDIEVFGLIVQNKENEEVLKIKYGNQEILINIDLVFKERTLVKALGLEVFDSFFSNLSNDFLRSSLSL